MAHSSTLHAHGADGHHHEDGPNNKTVYGFWIYLMTDCILFASLFATYAVLSHNYAGGPTAKDVFELGFVLVETFLLLISSITFGFAMIAMNQKSIAKVKTWLAITFLFGLGFIGMEVYEFHHLIHIGAGPDVSAFLSSYFVLVGTHGLHVTFGLIWLATMLIHLSKNGLTPRNQTRLMCLSLFWHFLDIVWICVFTVVYLLGVTL